MLLSPSGQCRRSRPRSNWEPVSPWSPDRDPIWTAKEVASLDVLSGGRVLFGIGYGWNKEELSHHGVAYIDRRQVLRERVLAMKELWTKDEASFTGEKVSFEPSWAWPKPVQQPHPPIIMGGEAGPKTIADMVEFCDGWMPLASRHDLAGKLDELRDALRAAGRDPGQFDLTAYGTKADPAVISHLIDLGVNRAVFNLPQRSREDVQSRVESIVQIVSSFK